MFGPPIPERKAWDMGPHMRRALLDLGEIKPSRSARCSGATLPARSIRVPGQAPPTHRHRGSHRRPASPKSRPASWSAVAAVLVPPPPRRPLPEKRIGIVLPPGRRGRTSPTSPSPARGRSRSTSTSPPARPPWRRPCKSRRDHHRDHGGRHAGQGAQFSFPGAHPGPEAGDRGRRRQEGHRAVAARGVNLLPNQWVADLLGLPRTGDREEAGLLFTSGSSGEPKGVVLTHRNIFANCAQISSLSILPDTAVLMACLPIFHSFGFTVTLWYPMLRGCRVVTQCPARSTPRRSSTAIQQEERVTVMVGAPTFVRPFLKKATKEELQSHPQPRGHRGGETAKWISTMSFLEPVRHRDSAGLRPDRDDSRRQHQPVQPACHDLDGRGHQTRQAHRRRRPPAARHRRRASSTPTPARTLPLNRHRHALAAWSERLSRLPQGSGENRRRAQGPAVVRHGRSRAIR